MFTRKIWSVPSEMMDNMAKSIADKVDVGCIISKVNQDMWDKYSAVIRTCTVGEEFKSSFEMPTHVIDVYKNRGGRDTDLRIWTRMNLGTGERKDLFITNQRNLPLDRPIRVLHGYDEKTVPDWKKEVS